MKKIMMLALVAMSLVSCSKSGSGYTEEPIPTPEPVAQCDCEDYYLEMSTAPNGTAYGQELDTIWKSTPIIGTDLDFGASCGQLRKITTPDDNPYRQTYHVTDCR